MNYDAIPVIRLEVQGMKAAIMAHMGAEGSELGTALSAEIDKAVANYPWQDRVNVQVTKIIDDAVSFYFRGEGRRLIMNAVNENLEEQFNHSRQRNNG